MIYMYSRREMLRYDYNSRRDMCGSRSKSRGGLTFRGLVCYNARTKLTSLRGIYKVLSHL
jgi:hypothetical protein